jgi:hypothetical protein
MHEIVSVLHSLIQTVMTAANMYVNAYKDRTIVYKDKNDAYRERTQIMKGK